MNTEDNILEFAKTNARIAHGGYMHTTEILREFLGKDINLRIKYTFHEGYPENETDPEELPNVEIVSIAMKFKGGWRECEASEEELKSISNELLGE